MPQPNVMPDIEALITEDDEPVDNMPSEKQQRQRTEQVGYPALYHFGGSSLRARRSR